MRKKIIFFIFFIFVALPGLFAQYEGTVGLGVHSGYAKEISSVGGGVHLHYYYTNNLRFAPSFTHFVPIKKKSMWEIDMDAHYLIPLNWEFSFYPIGGLLYSKWEDNSAQSVEFDDVGWPKKRLGLNLGAGFQYDFRYKARVSLEIKHQSIKDFSQMSVMLGVGFWI